MLGDAMKKRHWRFKAQAPMLDADRLYIVDFLVDVHHGKLVIEVDGPCHRGRESYDTQRTEWLNRQRHCFVLRFTAKEVLLELPRVMGIIRAYFPQSS